MVTDTDINQLLCRRIHKHDITIVINWAKEASCHLEKLYSFTKSADERISINALWCLSHLHKSEAQWLQSLQCELIDRLLVEKHMTKRRILLQLLRGQSYEKDAIRTDFLDYCFTKINSECEPCAIRSLSIYCAFKLCRHYPELIAELEQYIGMCYNHPMSPGLQCALRTTHNNIMKLGWR